MADNKLNVEIGATTKGLEKGLAVALKELDKLKDEQKQLNDAFKKGEISSKKYYKGLSQNALKLKSASAAVNKYKGNVSGLGKATSANATPALQEFSRVIQDAPFGIQGVANNITQLTSQFGYLQKSAGGTSAALKAMVGTLTGPAGILLAVSAVTSLMVSYGDEMLALIGTSKELQKAQADYVAEAKSEILTLRQLVEIAQDETKSKKIRQGAIDAINKNYSKYLGNLDLESIKTDKVTKSINALSQSLILKAKVDGIADLISEKTKDTAEDLLTLDLERNRLLEKQASLQDKVAKAESGRDKALNKRTLAGVNQALEATNKEISDLENGTNDALEPLLKLQKTLKETIFEVTPSGGDDAITRSIAKSVGSIGSGGLLINPVDILGNIKTGMQEVAAGMPTATAPLLAEAERFNTQFNELILGSTMNTLGMLGESIGVALAEGGNALAAVGQTLLAGLSDFLGNLGGMLIEYGTLAVAKGKLDLAILAGGPVAIGAGLAAIAVGVALKAASGALGSFAGSGGETGGIAGGGRESSGYSASSRGGGGSNAGGTYVFEIAGTKLVGVLQNTLERNRSLGGTNKLTFSI